MTHIITAVWSAIDNYFGGDGACSVPFCMLVVAIITGVLTCR